MRKEGCIHPRGICRDVPKPSGTELVISCVSRELIFAIRTCIFFFSGINFCDFQKVPDPAYIFVFNDYGVRTLCFKPVVHCIPFCF